MMAVGFAICRNMAELGSRPIIVQRPEQTCSELLTVIEQFLKSDGLRDGPVVEEQVDLISAGSRQ